MMSDYNTIQCKIADRVWAKRRIRPFEWLWMRPFHFGENMCLAFHHVVILWDILNDDSNVLLHTWHNRISPYQGYLACDTGECSICYSVGIKQPGWSMEYIQPCSNLQMTTNFSQRQNKSIQTGCIDHSSSIELLVECHVISIRRW